MGEPRLSQDAIPRTAAEVYRAVKRTAVLAALSVLDPLYPATDQAYRVLLERLRLVIEAELETVPVAPMDEPWLRT